MLSNPKIYTVAIPWGKSDDLPMGQYVLYSEYLRLHAENERLRAALADHGARMRAGVADFPMTDPRNDDEFHKLHEEIERLRASVYGLMPPDETTAPHVHLWVPTTETAGAGYVCVGCGADKSRTVPVTVADSRNDEKTSAPRYGSQRAIGACKEHDWSGEPNRDGSICGKCGAVYQL